MRTLLIALLVGLGVPPAIAKPVEIVCIGDAYKLGQRTGGPPQSMRLVFDQENQQMLVFLPSGEEVLDNVRVSDAFATGIGTRTTAGGSARYSVDRLHGRLRLTYSNANSAADGQPIFVGTCTESPQRRF